MQLFLLLAEAIYKSQSETGKGEVPLSGSGNLKLHGQLTIVRGLGGGCIANALSGLAAACCSLSRYAHR